MHLYCTVRLDRLNFIHTIVLNFESTIQAAMQKNPRKDVKYIYNPPSTNMMRFWNNNNLATKMGPPIGNKKQEKREEKRDKKREARVRSLREAYDTSTMNHMAREKREKLDGGKGGRG